MHSPTPAQAPNRIPGQTAAYTPPTDDSSPKSMSNPGWTANFFPPLLTTLGVHVRTSAACVSIYNHAFFTPHIQTAQNIRTCITLRSQIGNAP